MDNKTNVAKHAGRQRKTERPILFTAPMVRAILEGRKTQTRRVVKFPEIITCGENPDHDCLSCGYINDHPDAKPGFHTWLRKYLEEGYMPITCPLGQPGDRLWVREAWGISGCLHDPRIFYKADEHKPADLPYTLKWRPSIHMPRHLSRITLEVPAVRVERLQKITDEDAIAEGIFEVRPEGWLWADPSTTSTPNMTLAHTPRQAYMWLWNALYAKRPGSSWFHNPWVWVVEFRRIETGKPREAPNA